MGVFNASLRIIAYDHPSLLGEITVYVSDAGAPVTAVSVKVNKNGIVTIHMIVQVNSKEQLQQVLTKVRKRTDVIEAFRTAS
jgi:GTP pyrophosphokinase